MTAHATVNVLIDGAGLVLVVAPVALAYTGSEGGLTTLVTVIALGAVLLLRSSVFSSAARAF